MKHRPRPNIDMTGVQVGRLSVLTFSDPDYWYGSEVTWICVCSCGNMTLVRGSKLRDGSANSCGCYRKERMVKANYKHGNASRSGLSREYKVWSGMLDRCYYEHNVGFEHYGGRGISVCDKWKDDFSKFLADMGKCPPGYSLERIDVNGNYEPCNCKWIPLSDQQKNMRKTVRIEWNGEVKILADWSKLTGIDHTTIQRSIKRGLTLGEIISKLSKKKEGLIQ